MEHWPAHVDADFVAKLRAFVAERIAPRAHEIDREDCYPVEIVRALAREGYSTVSLPRAFGGAERSLAYNVAVFEEVSAASGAVGASLITIYLAQKTLELYAAPSIKE